MEETIVFIDAGFLSKLSKHFGNGEYIKHNIVGLANNLAKKQNLVCETIFYYTASPFQSSPATEQEKKMKEGYDRFIISLSSYKRTVVRQGRCQKIRNKQGVFEYNQKGVDTLLTMDLMSTPMKYPNVKTVILIACDSDFVPVIMNLNGMGVKTILCTYFDRKRNSNFSSSNELIKTVSKFVIITKDDFVNSLKKV